MAGASNSPGECVLTKLSNELKGTLSSQPNGSLYSLVGGLGRRITRHAAKAHQVGCLRIVVIFKHNITSQLDLLDHL